jgi:hypothetical protein
MLNLIFENPIMFFANKMPVQRCEILAYHAQKIFIFKYCICHFFIKMSEWKLVLRMLKIKDSSVFSINYEFTRYMCRSPIADYFLKQQNHFAVVHRLLKISLSR